MNAHLGMWPFDSEQENNIDDGISRAANLLEGRVNNKLTFSQKFRASIGGIPFTNDYGRFIRDYMAIAKSFRKAYTDNSEFYTKWEPALSGYGWAKDISEVMMQGMRELITSNSIEPWIANPANVVAPGDTSTNPIKSAVSTGFKWVLIAGVAYLVIKSLPSMGAKAYKAYKT